ncbi:hypothetical protein [Legionella spiritensis]|uniref:Dot/Icm T4SS effector n=1 Tax=Legionella spiritensis TaxID=452 RepID=A0A0W0Z0C3_LEGSP|nr:hypothetical protein [Legionella spiritensis]KTD62562.1 Dot/Icm T4SS effector [Legionella spiritensis]SNV30639.1 Dot/Icm secretion system substrate [Legionella spiritensis]
MGGSSFSVFLSKSTSKELCDLFREEKPNHQTINELISRLAEYENFSHLKLLLPALHDTEETDTERMESELAINRILLNRALQESNQEDITIRLKACYDLITDKSSGQWQALIDDVIQWMNSLQYSPKSLQTVLFHLPLPEREKFYQRVLEMAKETPKWLDVLVHFVMTHHTDTDYDSEINQHLYTLASYLLQSPVLYDMDDIKQLSLLVSTNQLVRITFQLRAIAATYVAKENKKKSSTDLRQQYLQKYENLATVLTARATTSEEEYQELANFNAELANLLMSKRLKSCRNLFGKQQTIVMELLENISRYNWQDGQFNALAMEHIAQTLAKMPHDELTRYFKPYYEHRKNNIHEITRFLDLFFQKTYDSSKLLACLTDNDDKDNTLTINYLTHTQTHDPFLIEQCFARLNETQLITLCCHVMAMKQLLNQEYTPLINTYCKVLADKIGSLKLPEPAFNNLAKQIAFLPEASQEELIHLIFAQFPKNPALQYQWLQALLTSDCCKTTLLSYSRTILKQSRPDEQIALLKAFSHENLLALYLHLVRQQSPPDEFSGFVKLFKDFSNQDILVYFLCNTPLIHPAFLDQVMPDIDSKTLITLIEELLLRTEENSDYTPTLEQLLLHFCKRLQTCFDEKDPIHQWTASENSSGIARRLLTSPACLHSLTSRSSIYQDYAPSVLQVTRPETDLKLRAIRVLNIAALEEKQARQFALHLLSRYRETPALLQTMFFNLESVETGLTEPGQQNYQRLKKACWEFLKNEEVDDYNPKQASVLLTRQLKTPHRFDGVLAQLAIDLEKDAHNAHLSAQYLTQVDSANLKHLDHSALIAILLKSMDEATRINWTKAAVYLESRELEYRLSFIRLLLEKIRDYDNNPLLDQQVWQFITGLPDIKTLLYQLNTEEIQWLMKQCSEQYLMEQFPFWLDILLHHPDAKTFQDGGPGELFALLPPNPSFLESLLEHPLLTPCFPQMFMCLAEKEHSSVHLIALFKQACMQGNEEKRKFLGYVHQHLDARQTRSTAIYVLNMLLSGISDLRAGESRDVAMITDQFRLFQQWIDNPAFDTLQRAAVTREIQQIVFNTLASFKELDLRWAGLLINNDSFTRLALHLLQKAEPSDLQHHPFTQVLLDNITIRFQPALQEHPIFQNYIKQLLSNPPSNLKDDQFAMLFNLLAPEEKKKLALDLLQRPVLDDVQWSSLITLSRALPVKTLFAIYRESSTRFIFVDLLARHPEGIASLKTEQRNELFSHLTSAKQLLRILDSQTAMAVKFTFVTAIFDYLKYKDISLETWLTTLNVDGQTLAALANYTTRENHQEQLRSYIENSMYYKGEIERYLCKPTLDIAIEKSGLLYQYLKNIWLHPEQGTQAYPASLKLLSSSTRTKALRTQSAFLLEARHLTALYSPLGSCENVAGEMLTALRWTHRLPLVNDGLLDIIAVYQEQETGSGLQKAIEQTSLFKKLIAPLWSDSDSCNLFEIEANELYQLLGEYASQIRKISPEQHHKITTVLQRYQWRLQILQQVSSPGLYHLMEPGSHLGKIQNGKINYLSPHDIKNLVTASDAGGEHDGGLSSSLPTCLKILANGQLALNPDIQQWLLHQVLLSPLANEIDNALLFKLLSKFQPTELAGRLALVHQDIKFYKQCFEHLKRYYDIKDVSTLISELYKCHVNDLACYQEACEFAQLPSLSRIISLTRQIKRTRLSKTAAEALLPGDISRHLEMEWVQRDLEQLPELASTLTARYERIETESYKYRPDIANSERLRQLTGSTITTTNIDGLISCLNSYLPAFKQLSKPINQQAAAPFIKTLHSLLTTTPTPGEILNGLGGSLLDCLIEFALQDPRQYENFLQYLLENGLADKCVLLFKNRIHDLLTRHINECESSPAPETLLDLSVDQLAALPPEVFESLLFLQRLLFMKEPLPELKDWQKDSCESNGRDTTAYFCADASLLALLNRLRQQDATSSQTEIIAQRLQYGFSFVREESKALSYWKTMDEFDKKNQYQSPAACLHYLYLFSFLQKSPDLLVHGFVNWLAATDGASLDKQEQLDHLLRYILDLNLLPQLCHVLQQQPEPDNLKLSWLFTRIERVKPLDAEIIPYIVRGFSWHWLQEKIKSLPETNRLEMLTAALQIKNHCHAIINDASNQQAFLDLLAHCHFPANDLIALQNGEQPSAIQSLISLHLLTRADYLHKLNKPSMLVELNKAPEKRIKRRLQPLVQRLDLTHLPIAGLKNMQPEAAATLFCSPKHFHEFHDEMVDVLLRKVGVQRDLLIQYWLRHYTSMPNHTRLLLILCNKFRKSVTTGLKDLAPLLRQNILMSLIEYQDGLEPAKKAVTLQGFIIYCDESHLVYAMHRYLYGHQNNERLQQFIIHLLEQLTRNHQQLSSQAIQLLIRICEDEPFAGLRPELQSITGNYLRSSALFADCSVFYDDERLAIKRLHAPVLLSSSQPEPSRPGNIFTLLLKPIFNVDEGPIESLERHDLPDNPLVNIMAEKFASIRAIDYFLIHYSGKEETLQRFLNDYLDYYTFGGTTANRLKKLHVIAWLLTREEIPEKTRQVIFDSFLNHPKLVDPQIAADLLRYSADPILKRLGRQKNYQELIDLCSMALPLLKTNPPTSQKVQQALNEAQFESSLTEMSSFLRSFRTWFKRCLFYGWTGWFKPKQPEYVLPFDGQVKKIRSESQQVAASVSLPKMPANLQQLLPLLNKNSSLAELTTLPDALTRYEWHPKDDKEPSLRKEVDKLFSELLERASMERDLESWLLHHKDPFVHNREQLIALYCRSEEEEPLFALLHKAKKNHRCFDDIAQEIHTKTEPFLLEADRDSPPEEPPQNVMNGVVETVTSLASYLPFWRTDKTKTTEAMDEDPKSGQQQKGWLSSWY